MRKQLTDIQALFLPITKEEEDALENQITKPLSMSLRKTTEMHESRHWLIIVIILVIFSLCLVYA